MRQLIILAGCIFMLACNNNKNKVNPVVEDKPAAAVATPTPNPSAPHPLAGNWVGMLGDNKLNVQLLHIDGANIEGRSVAAGNFRTLKGTISESSDAYTLHMQEPGDDKYDGEFDITIKKNGMICEGKWAPFDKHLKTKIFTLSKKEYVYKPTVGLYPDASGSVLKEDDVANLVKNDLRIMRNSIYARHGYSFKMKDMRELFDREDWYIPMNTDIRNELTAVEKKNEALIKRYEKYAAEFYDEFGR